MKHKLLALSIGTAVLFSYTAGVAGGHEKEVKGNMPKVYGRVDVAQTRVDADTASDAYWDVASYASRLGIKGELETDHNVSIIYKYEVEINPTEDQINSSDDSNFLKARNQYVGLKSSFGTVKLGRMDTPLKTSQGKVDIFSDHAADIKKILEGENREGDMLHYTSPKWNGVQAKLALIAGENNDSGNFDADANGISDGTSFSLAYKDDQYYAAVAVDSDVDKHDLVRVTATAKFGDYGVGALYQAGETGEGVSEEDHDGFTLSGYYKLGATKLKLQYGQSEDEVVSSGATTEYDLVAVGVDYKLAKPTTLYAEYTNVGKETATTDEDTNTLAFGIKHKF